MKPQNKVTIFMLVMIVMLSIYYFAMPGKPADNDDDDPTVVVSEEFKTLRKAKEDARDAMIQDLYDYIGTDVNPDQVNEALAAIDELRALTQNETLLEVELIASGFVDVYVEANTVNEVKVYLYTDTLSSDEAILVIDSAKARFGEDVKVRTRFGYEVN